MLKIWTTPVLEELMILKLLNKRPSAGTLNTFKRPPRLLNLVEPTAGKTSQKKKGNH